MTMMADVTIPFRTFWRACSALLDGEGIVSAAAAQFQIGNMAAWGARAMMEADMTYSGKTPVPGLTDEQSAMVERLLHMASPELHAGLRAVIAAGLFAVTSPPYRTQDVVAAATTVTARDHVWFPDTGGHIDATISHVMAASAALSSGAGPEPFDRHEGRIWPHTAVGSSSRASTRRHSSR